MTPELWQRLKPLYHAALEIPIEGRSRFVAEACGDDDNLRAELVALLNAGAEQTGHDVTAPLLNLRDLFPTHKPFDVGLLILGRFRIVRRVGSGGMGDVYEATDLELGRVALKTIRADIAYNPELLTRFKREVQLARKVSGPHVCRIHELFLATGDGTGWQPPFLTMEFLDGITLADKMSESGPIPWREAREIALEISAGLQAIHQAGIIHRDLKSRNIMLAERNGRTCAVLMDFGLASEVDRTTDISSSGLTRTGAVVGTPDYMAPEQFESGTLSPATDIYALGVVMYEMLTGKQPFAGASPIAAAVRRGRRLESVSSLQPGLPGAWDEIVGKCLEYRSEDRYQSVVELQKDLESLLAGGRRLFRSTGREVGRTARLSHVRLWLFIVIASIVAAAAVIAILQFYPRSEPCKSVSTEQISESGDITHVAISPDGKTLAEVRSAGGQHAVWIRNISTNREVEILGPSHLKYGRLVFARDGNGVYFARTNDVGNSFNLYQVSVLGGEPGLIAAKIEEEFTLSPDEKQLAYARRSKGLTELHILTFANNDDSVLMKVTDAMQSSPEWSPNGLLLAWVSQKGNSPAGANPAAVTILNLKSKKIREVALPADTYMCTNILWLPTGKELLLLLNKGYNGLRSPGGQVGLLSIDSGDFRQLTNDMIAHSELALSGDGKTIATLLQQDSSEIAFFDRLKAAQISSVRLPRMFYSFVWLDEDRLLATGSGLDIVRRDNREFADFGLILPPSVYSIQEWQSNSINTAPAVCPDGELILSGALNGENQLYRVDSRGHFLRTLVKTKHHGGNAFCDQENQLAYYGEDGSSEPSILSALTAGAPNKAISMPQGAPVVYAADGKLAAYVLNDAGRSTGTIVNLEQRKVARELPLVDHVQGTLPHFTADAKALGFVEQSKEGFAISLQPLDASTSRQLTSWFKDPITDFGWSPSGKLLAIMWDKSTSDVALITDKSAKPSD
jgi:serine/threonine protein kinase/Tol biopolymer transport system component